MTDQVNEKTDLEKSRDIISQLKEMHHYSKENIVKLGEFWLLLEGELKQKENAKMERSDPSSGKKTIVM